MIAVKLNAVQVLALSCLGVVVGAWLTRRIRVLDRLNIPAPIAGGLIYALITLVLRDRWMNFDMDLVLRGILQDAFFTTIGMSASTSLIRRGGPQVVWFWIIATIGAVLQNTVGVGAAILVGVEPLLGIISGSTALTGGPATALAFGLEFEKMGIEGARTVGVASAIFGITAGGLLGGFIGGRLIERRGLRPVPARPEHRGEPEALVFSHRETKEVAVMEPPPPPEGEGSPRLMSTVAAIAIAMGIGTLLSALFQYYKLTLPSYVGAMIAAAVVRNLDDRLGWIGISENLTEEIGGVALNVFIVMALLTLPLWELARLALPLLGMLLAQVVLIALMCLLVYRLMGRDYEAAVMSSGFCGFMLGTTANAMACMGVLSRKYGPAPRAFIVVPLVGAFLIDFTNALVITTMSDLVRRFI